MDQVEMGIVGGGCSISELWTSIKTHAAKAWDVSVGGVKYGISALIAVGCEVKKHIFG
jgi:hypothetical protein